MNFARKKAQLSYAKPKTQQMLSSFAYTKFAKLLKARWFDAGIEVVDVNPAYSSNPLTPQKSGNGSMLAGMV
ncbi:MAG: hypothetical protein ACLPSH_06030 [Vulcanimicrobiaceae bacterium]